jgi:hypothetical protein
MCASRTKLLPRKGGETALLTTRLYAGRSRQEMVPWGCRGRLA